MQVICASLIRANTTYSIECWETTVSSSCTDWSVTTGGKVLKPQRLQNGFKRRSGN